MTEHEPRTLWTDEQLDEALHTLRARDTGDLSGPRAALHEGLDAPRRRHRRWPYAAVAAGVAVVAAVGLVVTDPFGGHPAGTTAGGHASPTAPPHTGTTVTAAGALNLAAEHTTTIADVTVRPGQYLYVDNSVKSVSQEVGKLAWRQTFRTQTWVPADGTGTWTQTNTRVGPVEWLVGSAAEAAKEGTDATKPGPPAGTVTAACGDFRAVFGGQQPSCDRPDSDLQQATPAMLAALPRDPHKLLDQLREGQPLTSDNEYSVLQRSWLILQSGLVHADLRATIYRMLALLPDLKVTERSANLDGERGTALGITMGDTRLDVILNPDTSQLVGERIVQVDKANGLPAGTVIDASSFHVKAVGSAGATG
jgi:hypothetical protein